MRSKTQSVKVAKPSWIVTSNKKKGIAQTYLHGYSPKEQERLYRQARLLEPSVYERVDFSKQKQILEVGCGVGAQTQILLRRFPHLKVQGIDASREQITRAKKHLRSETKKSRAKFDVGDVLNLPYSDNSFDGAFVCWFLEHVQRPIEILREIKRVLKASATIYCNEVLNATFYVHPYSPATLQYWFALNDHQWTMKGDPFVGGKLANYLLEAGYQNIQTHAIVYHFDNRTPKRRAQVIDWWAGMMLSAAPELLKAKKIKPALVQEMKSELDELKNDPDAVFFYSWIHASAQAF